MALYQLYGFILGFAIKQLFWLPHRFRYGIYVAAGWGNYGDVRQSNTRYCLICTSKPCSATATIMSIMATTPFHGQADVNLGVAYISVVIIVFVVRRHYPYSSDKQAVFIRVSPSPLLGYSVPTWRLQADHEGF